MTLLFAINIPKKGEELLEIQMILNFFLEFHGFYDAKPFCFVDLILMYC